MIITWMAHYIRPSYSSKLPFHPATARPVTRLTVLLAFTTDFSTMERTDDVKAVIYDNKHTSSQSPIINKDVTQTPKKMSSPSDEAWGPLFQNKQDFVEKHIC